MQHTNAYISSTALQLITRLIATLLIIPWMDTLIKPVHIRDRLLDHPIHVPRASLLAQLRGLSEPARRAYTGGFGLDGPGWGLGWGLGVGCGFGVGLGVGLGFGCGSGFGFALSEPTDCEYTGGFGLDGPGRGLGSGFAGVGFGFGWGFGFGCGLTSGSGFAGFVLGLGCGSGFGFVLSEPMSSEYTGGFGLDGPG